MSPKNNHDPTSSGDTGNTNVQEADLREMEDVNQSLDALSCALDAVEQRTDDIMSQLRELLNSNREIRRQLEKEKENSSGHSDDDEEADDNMDGGVAANENVSK
ncbi:uncharacterized protein Dwil_GK16166 [Drosophila willistoni]|uniref:Uncharacterized protein n=1 Tax=Drosophila willistoni TaxID=7260 RepID=B4N280_DROWI|nr:UPF0184 protein CG14818 [Drosophila willistoni]EDW78469.1 uncharacterized protein Dwil_GK16166 [Drosophila willistoni]